MNQIIEKIRSVRIIPVIVLKEAGDVIPLAEILAENGLPAAEITFRSDCAAEAVSLLKKSGLDMIIGAGTLLNRENIRKAADAGADFFVSPGFNPVNVEYAVQNNLLMIPGVSSPSLVEQAMNYGLEVLKFFPASEAGGTGMLKAFHSVYPEISFMPTGGITASNVSEYLALPNVIACGGSWMAGKDLVAGHEWKKIELLVKEAVSIAAG